MTRAFRFIPVVLALTLALCFGNASPAFAQHHGGGGGGGYHGGAVYHGGYNGSGVYHGGYGGYQPYYGGYGYNHGYNHNYYPWGAGLVGFGLGLGVGSSLFSPGYSYYNPGYSSYSPGYTYYNPSMYSAPLYDTSMPNYYMPTQFTPGYSTEMNAVSPAGYAASSGAPARMEINVPADAQLWLNGASTTLTGATRLFQTPPLTSGPTYTYEVKAKWQQDGKEKEATRTVTVQPGGFVRVDMKSPAAEGTPVSTSGSKPRS